MKDIVITDGNEKEFVLMAEKLGYTELWFVGKVDITKLQKMTKIKIVSRTDIAESSDKDRMLIERKKASLIYDFEKIARKDSLHFRSSGLNQVLCKLMNAKKISVGISFRTVLNNVGMLRSQILGRMMQNVRLCRKYKVDVIVASFATKPYEMRDSKDLEAFGRVLGL